MEQGICIGGVKLKVQDKLKLCFRNHVVYRQIDRSRSESSIPPQTLWGRGIIISVTLISVFIPNWCSQSYKKYILVRDTGTDYNVIRHGRHRFPDSKVHGGNMEPTCGRQGPGGPHVGHVNIAIWVVMFNQVECDIQFTFFNLIPIWVMLP